MDLSALSAARRYTAAEPATRPQPRDPQAAPFAQAAQSFADTLRAGEQTAMSAMSGGGADAHALVKALAETELAVETVSTIRDRVVEAYKEILRMPI